VVSILYLRCRSGDVVKVNQERKFQFSI